ncbi:MAG: hypothetical protein ACPF83_04935, partial [Flavobacteriales bacterium]
IRYIHGMQRAFTGLVGQGKAKWVRIGNEFAVNLAKPLAADVFVTTGVPGQVFEDSPSLSQS